MTAVNYLWNPINDNIVEEFDDAGNTIAEYTTEPGQFGDVISQFRDGQESFYHTDGQGSTLALTNSNGDVTDTYAYSAFGEVTSQTGTTVNSFRYIGQRGYYLDSESGEYFVRRRPLSANGRWWALDPRYLMVSIGENLYTYVTNRPTVFIDPSGLDLIGPDDKTTISKEERAALGGCACATNRVILTTVPPDVIGLVYCKDNNFIVMLNAKPDKSLIEEQKCFYLKICADKHEKHHIDTFKALCPTLCKDVKCGIDEPDPRKRWFFQTGWSTQACTDTSECFAYITSISCVINLYKAHKEKSFPQSDPACVPVGIAAIKRYLARRKTLRCAPLAAELQAEIDKMFLDEKK
ncbi:MAG: RHS repeat domain-containing protein [Pirellulaceae bacterium]